MIVFDDLNENYKMQSVLNKATKDMVISQPFPHLVIHDVLEPDYYDALSRTFPKWQYPNQSNVYSNFRSTLALSDEHTDPIWKEFVRYHTSGDFYKEIIYIFGDHIRQHHPLLEDKTGKRLEEFETGMFDDDNPMFPDDESWYGKSLGSWDIRLECDASINTPVTKESLCGTFGPHVDRQRGLYAGLLYMRLDNDNSVGGDLEICAWKEQPEFFSSIEAVPRAVESIKTIKYTKNMLVFFINSIISVHGVSARSITPLPRRLIHLFGRVRDHLFDINAYQQDKIK